MKKRERCKSTYLDDGMEGFKALCWDKRVQGTGRFLTIFDVFYYCDQKSQNPSRAYWLTAIASIWKGKTYKNWGKWRYPTLWFRTCAFGMKKDPGPSSHEVGHVPDFQRVDLEVGGVRLAVGVIVRPAGRSSGALPLIGKGVSKEICPPLHTPQKFEISGK